MKIVLCSQQTVRGIEQRLADAIVRHSPHEVRVVTDIPWDPEGHAIVRRDHEDARNEALDWADVVHFFGATSPRLWNRIDLLFSPSKRIVWQQFNSWADRSEIYSERWFEGDLLHARLAVVSEGWDEESWWKGREHVVLPPIFPVNREPYLPAPFEERKRVVSFAPKKTVQALPSPKFVSATIAALEGARLDLIRHTPWRACMARKRTAWVGIDEVVTPRIHFSGLEYVVLGVPCFNLWNEATERAIVEGIGSPIVPFLPTSLSSIGSDARAVLEAPSEAWRERCAAARAWAEEWLDEERCVRRYIQLYEAP